MLTELVVEGLGVIERAELELGAGCTALTGETGAGKTLVVAALELLLGGRGDRGLVREGFNEARVEGRFVVPADHGVVATLVAQGILEEPSGPEVELVLARSVSAGPGAARARINGRLVTAGSLTAIGGDLVEIAGQHAARGISEPARQRALLDSFAGVEATETAGVLRAAVRRAAGMRRELADLVDSRQARERELDVLRYEIGEIESVGLREGEIGELTAHAARLENAGALAAALGGAVEALRGEDGAGDLIDAAHAQLASAVALDPALEELAGRLAGAALEVADVADEVTRRVVTSDPEALEAVRDRIGHISRLRRKYGDDEAAILGYLMASRERVAELETSDDSIERLTTELDKTERDARSLARRLSDLRAEAAPRLADAVEARLGALALPGARFEVRIEPRGLYEGGAESVELLVAANPGETPRPISRIASGGELSRIALALHVLTSGPSARTMVFDEVDAGVGGRSAQSVGRALAELAGSSGAQVIVVTHLPQVAAYADSHLRVIKTSEGRARATVEAVAGARRVDELSRMLAGMPESERAREHAQELLEMAGAGAKR